MSAPATIPAQLAADLGKTLARLRQARSVGDEIAEIVAADKLNHLLDRIPRTESATQCAKTSRS